MKDRQPFERLIGFENCDSITGESISKKIIQLLRRVGLQPILIRAQTYDGAGNMAGRLRGCAAQILKEFPPAETRWIECHSTMEDFDDLYPALCNCLDDIACNIGGMWDSKAVTEANGIFHSIAKPCFIAAFKVNHYIFGFTILLELRENAEYEFKPLFQSILDMAEIVHLEGMPVPRICQRQTARSNFEALSPMEYWRRTVFVPFLDHLLQELDN